MNAEFDFYSFLTYLLFLDTDVNVPTVRNINLKTCFFVGILKVNEEKSWIRLRQNVMYLKLASNNDDDCEEQDIDIM